VEAALERYPRDRVVLIDEAYIAFGGESAIPLIRRFENLVVVHTFSKSESLAGLRLGLAFAHPDLIAALFRAKDAFNSYPVHDLAQRIGIAALSDREYYEEISRRIVSTREEVSGALSARGWQVVPSRANFIFTRRPGMRGKDLYRGLRERGILVRHFDTPSLTDFLRISIGTDDEMARLLAAVAQIERDGERK
jgi:histidinol-phosphate aminotransferase